MAIIMAMENTENTVSMDTERNTDMDMVMDMEKINKAKLL